MKFRRGFLLILVLLLSGCANKEKLLAIAESQTDICIEAREEWFQDTKNYSDPVRVSAFSILCDNAAKAWKELAKALGDSEKDLKLHEYADAMLGYVEAVKSYVQTGNSTDLRDAKNRIEDAILIMAELSGM